MHRPDKGIFEPGFLQLCKHCGEPDEGRAFDPRRSLFASDPRTTTVKILAGRVGNAAGVSIPWIANDAPEAAGGLGRGVPWHKALMAA